MTEPRLDGHQILVVEDEPLIALDVGDAFQMAGANVTMARTLQQAIVHVERDNLSGAVLDHALPDGDSDLLCARLKEREIPFIVYTGFGSVPGECSEGPHISKPASGTQIVMTMEGLLKNRTPKSAQ
jgi:DNA-binding NtrC family response regulator